jgi:hypothetical protein
VSEKGSRGNIPDRASVSKGDYSQNLLMESFLSSWHEQYSSLKTSYLQNASLTIDDPLFLELVDKKMFIGGYELLIKTFLGSGNEGYVFEASRGIEQLALKFFVDETQIAQHVESFLKLENLGVPTPRYLETVGDCVIFQFEEGIAVSFLLAKESALHESQKIIIAERFSQFCLKFPELWFPPFNVLLTRDGNFSVIDSV